MPSATLENHLMHIPLKEIKYHFVSLQYFQEWNFPTFVLLYAHIAISFIPATPVTFTLSAIPCSMEACKLKTGAKPTWTPS